MYNGDVFTRMYNTPYLRACNEESVHCEQPPEIKVGLRPHQKAIIHKMSKMETDLQGGYDISGEKLYSRFAVLGDAVGVGKSLMVLGHIAKMKHEEPNTMYNRLNVNSTSNLYSIKVHQARDLSNCRALLVVPHTLFRQWQDYIETQTTLKAYLVKTKRYVEDQAAVRKMMDADVTLVSNTLYPNFLAHMLERVWFSRVYFDEADSIHIPGTNPFPFASFVWFVSASWPNLLFENERVWISQGSVERITAQAQFPRLDPLFQSQLLNALVGGRGYFNRYYVRSSMYFKDFFRVQHSLRTHLVLRCTDSFIEQSISLPPLFTQIIQCEPTIAQHIVGRDIPQNIQTLLNAGDVDAALTALGVPTDSPMNLIQAVTANRMKELERLEKTYEFKSNMDYATPQAKEQALEHLQGKITSLKQQIDNIRQRIENYKKEICAICYDEPQEPVLTPCCSRIFCAACILMSLSRIQGCPMCRAQILPNKLSSVSETKQSKKEVKAVAGPPKKIEALVNLIRSKPNDKFLVFSRYENPFRQMQDRLESDQIQVQTVKGNKDVINNLITKFDEGQLRVLLLNSNHAGAGLNITSATYVVLWHAMSIEEEKQILGRAYRMGRTQPLHFVKLVHPDEAPR